MKPLAPLLPALLLAAPLAAQPLTPRPAGPEHLASAALDSAARHSPEKLPQPLSGRVLGNRGPYTYLVLRRTGDGQAEVHADWDDVMVVREGAATLLYGGEVRGGAEQEAGEHRGGEIVGGTRQPLAAGDMMVIPAGVPHQVLVPEGGAITYAVIKVRKRVGPM
ncbi:MAG TPA: hypothetical protein VFQ45_18730 [Longimicrobium sp.]|nr:hypothetical protein [Longimicrobium sp.]